MSLRPSLSLVYGVRIPAADVDRVRALCDAGALPGCEVWDGGKVAQPYAIVGATGSLRPLVTCDGDLADGLPLDVEALPHDLGGIDDVDGDGALRRAWELASARAIGWPRWWIVGSVS